MHSCLEWVGVYGSGASASSLRCRGRQRGACLDRISLSNQNEWNLDRDKMNVQKKFNGQINLSKYTNSARLSSDGPFVENDERTNNEILQSFCIRGKLLNAAKLIDVMTRRNQIPDFLSCIKLIRGLINIDRTRKAVNVLQLMVLSGGIPDIITYNMLISGLCQKKYLNSAIDILENMSLSGCPPDVITYNTILRAMFENGRFDQAIQFWKDQLRKGCPPYLITYTVLIELVCKHIGIVHALEIMEDLTVEGC
ncbi:Hypothetical predicted protein [Olea europaea subsp. europaea]|uniref:Pentatricopeptide repeat-containing protein n=1 Tax=Olea europaea subsp. europaea TaxID=158383 RepID=A0A8S0QVI8_OLEEU|nr:Hypothetical predicted protein [Olea europaea subsp. europaea]